MKDLAKIVSKEKFINAFNICKEYCQNNDNIIDVNFRLIKTHLLDLTESKVSTFYDKYVSTELIYAFPEFHSCERVTIPKNSTGTREYRYFSTFSMILYNAIGLCVVDSCNDVINSLSFNEKSIYPFYPTKFIQNQDSKSEKNKWKVSNNYKAEYKKYTDKLEEITSENSAILQIDITQYFESIVHEKLLRLLYKYANKSSLSKNNLGSDSQQIFEFYLEALMLKRFSIPQGRKNFISDYFGYFYLVPLDMNIEALCTGYQLKFKGMVRYVDDITLVFENPDNINIHDVYRELLVLESKIINWILSELNLNVNPNKTNRKYIRNKSEKEIFIEKSKKSISGIELIEKSQKIQKNQGESSAVEIELKYEEYKQLLLKFQFSNVEEFKLDLKKKDIENLKLIYNKSFQSYLIKDETSREVSEILKTIEVELTVDFINMLIVLFLLKHKKNGYIFRSPIDTFLNKNFKPNDKRHIQIIHVILAQESIDKEHVFDMIKSFKSELSKDNYGKYLLTFARNHTNIKKVTPLDEDIFFFRLNNEFINSTVQSHNHYLYHLDDQFQLFIKTIIAGKILNQAISDQLKNYVLYRRIKKWDLAFNHFHNLFHEICKLRLNLSDGSKVSNISSNKIFSLEDQLLINKFFSRRNFNSISHPSQNEIASEKVDKLDLFEFETRIIEITIKLLNHEIEPTT